MEVCTMMSPYIMANTALRMKGRVSWKPGFFSRPERLTDTTGTNASPAFLRALRSRWM